MVRDGTPCGEKLVCVNQTCISLFPYIDTSKCPTDITGKECSGHGVSSKIAWKIKITRALHWVPLLYLIRHALIWTSAIVNSVMLEVTARAFHIQQLRLNRRLQHRIIRLKWNERKLRTVSIVCEKTFHLIFNDWKQTSIVFPIENEIMYNLMNDNGNLLSKYTSNNIQDSV